MQYLFLISTHEAHRDPVIEHYNIGVDLDLLVEIEQQVADYVSLKKSAQVLNIVI